MYSGINIIFMVVGIMLIGQLGGYWDAIGVGLMIIGRKLWQSLKNALILFLMVMNGIYLASLASYK